MNRRTFLTSTLALAACAKSPRPIQTCTPRNRGGTASGSTTLTPADFLTDGCAMPPDDILGPYYVCVDDYRSAIAEDRPGAALRLGFRVVDAACNPVPDAVVDVWHCDAEGNYSAFDADPDLLAGTSTVHATNTRFCRGAQVANDDGIVEFQTIFPGWYAGRTTHIHVRVYLPDGRQFTTQTYFAESVRDALYAQAPYDAPRDATYPRNADERIAANAEMHVTLGDNLTATLQLVI